MNQLRLIPFLLSVLLFGSCGTFTETGGENAGYEMELTDLPELCCTSRKDALAVSININNGNRNIGPFGANQTGTSIKRVFKKNSVTGADPFEDTSNCQPLKFCLTITNITEECAEELSKALDRPVQKGSTICTGWITPDPCGTWEFDLDDIQ